MKVTFSKVNHSVRVNGIVVGTYEIVLTWVGTNIGYTFCSDDKAFSCTAITLKSKDFRIGDYTLEGKIAEFYKEKL